MNQAALTGITRINPFRQETKPASLPAKVAPGALEPPLRREDFGDLESYLRWLRKAGYEPSESELDMLSGTPGGYEADLVRGTMGWSKRQRQYAWEKRGHSEWVGWKDFRKSYNAVAFSNRLGAVMNVHMTIVWGTVLDGGDLVYAGALKRFLERFRKWCRERSIQCHWIFAWERGPKNGLHSHVLASVPHLYEAELQEWAHKAIETVSGKPSILKPRRRKSGAAKVTHTLNIVHRRDGDIRAQWGLFRYPMKGISPDLFISDLDNRRQSRRLSEIAAISVRPQGLVTTKRVGVSRAIDVTMQRKTGFVSALDRGATKPDELYTDKCYSAFQRDEERREFDRTLSQLEI